MKILTEYISFEENIKGSRFLSELFPCESQAAARELIKAQKAKYADATHVVHAFIIGQNAEIMGMSDDGEPSGTAGRPALDVLKGSGCTNLIITITRWFGGTLLGTGGLVKAYSGGAKGVLTAADSAGLFEELVEKTAFQIKTDYSLLKKLQNCLASYKISNYKEDFLADVTLTGEIPSVEFEEFCARVVDLTNGKCSVEKV
ncbi:MAG: IMPACT family protein [Treponema sp.]|nr:IMPACT family protein [Treponema sp.]